MTGYLDTRDSVKGYLNLETAAGRPRGADRALTGKQNEAE